MKIPPQRCAPQENLAAALTEWARVALSSQAKALLDLLDASGRPANAKRLVANFGTDNGGFDSALKELFSASLVVPVGRGGRLARKSVAAAGLSVEAQMLFGALPSDGGAVGNYSLRSQLALDDATYAQAKRELRDKGLITVGVGYGGTIARAVKEAIASKDGTDPPQLLVVRENELYQVFVDWLRASLQDQELAFAHVKNTATPRGYRRAGGKWSRPDVTAVQVFRYEWLPDVTVEVSTYEIKRATDAEKLESVYEAAAHGRWAHRVSLVVEQDGDGEPVPPAIYEEVRRFRLGLYTMRSRGEGKFEVREVIKPPLTSNAQPEDVNDLLSFFLGDDRGLRGEYRRAIGR